MRRGDAPPEIGRSAETAAVEKTSDPAETVGDRHCRSKNIQHPDSVKFLFPRVNYHGSESQQKSAVKNQSALIDAENFYKIILKITEKLNLFSQNFIAMKA